MKLKHILLASLMLSSITAVNANSSSAGVVFLNATSTLEPAKFNIQCTNGTPDVTLPTGIYMP